MADVDRLTLSRCFQYLIERSHDEFFGTVTFTFRKGEIVRLQPEQTFVKDHEIPIADEAAVELMRTGRYTAPDSRRT